LLAHGRWFSPGTLASSTTKTGRHDIAGILLKVALSTINQSINQSIYNVNYGRFCCICVDIVSYSLDGIQLDVDVLAEEVKKKKFLLALKNIITDMGRIPLVQYN
jgi:hypothetical protein